LKPSVTHLKKVKTQNKPKTMDEYLNPKWEQVRRVHDWKNHVPEHIQKKWDSFDDTLKKDLYLWAEQLADAEEWE
jgi:hypothetical protein